MITPISGLIKNLKAVQADLAGIAMEAAFVNEDNIIKLQQAQLYAGKQSTGKRIRPRYAAYTIQYKRSVGQPTDRVTLLDHGDFYDSIFIDFQKDRFYLGAIDKKTKKIVKKYGKDIFGLSVDSTFILSRVMIPDMIRIILTRIR